MEDFNPNLIDQWHIHIIVKAVESGVPEIVHLLIDAGVDLLNDDTKLNGKTILEVAEDMRQHFDVNENFINLAGAGNFADDSIVPEHIPTERESSVISQGLPVYRAYLKRR
jgi:hypothetical protein